MEKLNCVLLEWQAKGLSPNDIIQIMNINEVSHYVNERLNFYLDLYEKFLVKGITLEEAVVAINRYDLQELGMRPFKKFSECENAVRMVAHIKDNWKNPRKLKDTINGEIVKIDAASHDGVFLTNGKFISFDEGFGRYVFNAFDYPFGYGFALQAYIEVRNKFLGK